MQKIALLLSRTGAMPIHLPLECYLILSRLLDVPLRQHVAAPGQAIAPTFHKRQGLGPVSHTTGSSYHSSFGDANR